MAERDDDEAKILRETLFGDDDDEEEDLDDPAVTKTGDGAPAEGRGAGSAGAGRTGYDSEDDNEGVATDADKHFIEEDDDNVFGTGSEEEEDGVDAIGQAEQAEEADEFDGDEFEKIQAQAKAKRKRKHDEDEQSLQHEIDSFLARMEFAWENDVQANQEKKPAIHKLKLTREMTEKLSQAHLQRRFLEHKDGLTLLTRWLEPLPDMSLPNINIRTAILKLLLQMPIHAEEHEGREQLKSSRIGRVVMFLSRLPEETAANRRMAKELVERWSRPIFLLESKHAHAATEERVRQAPPQVEARARATVDEQLDEDGNPVQKKGPAPGERGWRWHASIPQTSKLDYKVRPEPKFSKEAMSQKSDTKSKHDKLDRKIKGMQVGNKRSGADGPVKVSVEGRGLLQ